MHFVDAIVIAAYVLTLVAIGLRFSGRQKTTDAYFVAGRSVPGWAAGLSLLATTITSVTFIAYPGAAYAGDWTLLGPGILFLVVIVAIGPIVVPFFRHAVSLSVYEYFGQRFGCLVRIYAAITFALGSFAKMGFVFYLLALSVASFTGWPMGPLIAGLGIITVFYTLVGGFSAVIWTDVAQGVLLWSGVAVTIVILLFFSGAKPAAMFHLIAASGKMSLGSPHFDLARPTFWTLALYGIFFYFQRYTADQSVVQRYLAAKSDRAALLGMAMGASLCLPVWTAFMLIGSLLWALYRITGQTLPAAVSRADQVFPYYMVSHMPPGMSGIFLAALFGAAMSMLASDLNCVGLILVQDFYGQFLPGRTDAERLGFGKVVIVVCGMLAIAVALGLTHLRGSALALYYAATAILAGGLAGLFLLAFLCRRAGRAAALIGIGVNLVFTIYAALTLGGGKIINLHGLNYPWSEYTIGACGNVLFLAAGLLGAALYPVHADGSLRHTLWEWLATRKQAPTPAMQLGDSV
jgi:solute:Na+ symporter, SSS family